MYIRLQRNGAEGIIEPFYDGGESYPKHEKYSSLDEEYKVTPSGAAVQSWIAVDVKVMPNASVTMERDCDLDVGRFDEFSVKGKIVEGVSMKVLINGEEILCQDGLGDTVTYYAKLRDRHIKKIRLEFENKNDSIEALNLWSLGVRDSKFLSDDVLYCKGTYPDWEGCFSKNPTIEPCTEVLVDKKEADALRQKMKGDVFGESYLVAKEYAQKCMSITPEKFIGRFLQNIDGVEAYIAASTLAFVGFVEKDMEMLKMSVRFALSVASCEYWCGFPDMEMLPATTWHHRSFAECYTAYGVAVTLEFAGSIMSWHGRNILYDALMQKALPRLDADFKTMEYIYHMNQGVAFSTGYAYALVTLAKQYPRYEKRILEIEEDIADMIKGSVNPDGGMCEGPAYWDYTIQMYVNTACVLARYHNKPLSEYVGNRLDSTSDFALIMANNDNQMRTVGDSRRISYSLVTSYFLAEITKNPKWIRFAEETRSREKNGGAGLFLFYLIFAKEELSKTEAKAEDSEIFITLPDTGYTYLKRGDDEFFGISGKSFSHCHPDKSSFMLDCKNKPVLIDRGMCGYQEGVADKLSESRAHNMAVPVVDGVVISQNAQHGYSATVVRSEYKDKKLTWISDNDNVWDKETVKKNVRTITSDKPFEYIITDEFEFTKPCRVLFNLNMYDDKHIEAEAVNWTPEKCEYTEHYCDFAKTPVMQKRFWSEEGTKFSLITRVTVKP